MASEMKEIQPSQQNTGGFDPGDPATNDTANKALFDALQFSFKILKIVMLIAVIAYLASGTFQVQPDEVALVTRFGRVVGTGPERELQQGLHWSWPWPINRHIKVQKGKVKTVACDFWYQISDMERLRGRAAAGNSLVPGKDEFIITGDANIVHVSLIINYGIIDAYNYILSFEGAETWNPNTNPHVNPEHDLIGSLASTAVIRAAGQFKVDDLIGSQRASFSTLVYQYLQQSLRELNCGLELRDVLIQRIEPPRQVIAHFNEVRNAAEQMHGDIQDAMGEATQLLTKTAGLGYEELIQAIQREQEFQKTSDPLLAEAAEEVEGLLDQAGGSVQEILSDAKIYKTRVVESARADAEYLQELIPRYNENPHTVMTRLLLGTLEGTLGKVRKWYVPTGVEEIRIMIDRDPDEIMYRQ